MADPVIPTSQVSSGAQSQEANGGGKGGTATGLQTSQGTVAHQKYNQLPYDVELYLENSGTYNGSNKYPINPAAVLNLNIQDSVLDWVVRGTLAFLFLPDKHNGTGRTGSNTGNKVSTATAGAIQNNDIIKSYHFRADGFDLLRVLIIPRKSTSNQARANTNKSGSILIPEINTDGDPKWTLSYLFSITDIEDISRINTLKGPMGDYMKCYKLYFEDVRYTILKNTNLEYSTALNPNANFNNNLANRGSLFTGDAMLEVFNAALTNPEAGGAEAYRINGVSPAQTAQQQGPPNPAASVWDKGYSEIFYTSPAEYTAEEDIDYLLAHHVSEVPLQGIQGPPSPEQPRDICLLHTERPTQPNFLEKISLTPLSNFFQRAGSSSREPGPLQFEHFFITGQTHTKTGSVGLYGAPIGDTLAANGVDIKTAKYGQILSYSFVDMSPLINTQNLVTRPVYSVDVGKRQFNIEFANNDVLTAKRLFSASYIDQLYKITGTGEDLFLNQLHSSKKRTNVFPVFSLNGDNKTLRQKNSLHQLLYTNLFQSTCICFETLGLSMRESGTFIGIDQIKGFTPNDYNNKLFGQYFVVKVEHNFEGGLYTNRIHAVKLHRVRPLEEPFKNTIADVKNSTPIET